VLADERALLVRLYLNRRIPVDQYERLPGDLQALTVQWNQLTGRQVTGPDLFHYMRTQRKRGLWVTFDGAHLVGPEVAHFSADETELLVSLYGMHVAGKLSGSDAMAYDEEVVAILGKEFAATTGRIVLAHEIVAKLTGLRKRGLLPKVGEQENRDDIGFTDIDEAAG